MPPSKEHLKIPFISDIDPDLINETETLIASALLLGMDHVSRKVNTADAEIPPLSFENAVSFMKSRVPVTKKEWNNMEPKLRFRAFTVARLTQCDYIDTARKVLTTAMETGKGIADTFGQIKDAGMDLRPGHWENVFRTNTQTAYTTGKLMQFWDRPPPAWRLLIVDDSRTSEICRGLIQEGKQSLTLSANHPFWKKFGFPPYHYQCRTGLQAVYKSEIDDGVIVEDTDIEELGKYFKPMEGFGGNPLDKESWWMMTENMALRAARYGIFNEVESFARENGLYNFALNLVRGESVEKLIGTNYAARKAAIAKPLPKELYAAKILEGNGHTVFFTPVNRTTKNYDAIIDGRLGEFKKLDSFQQIKNNLNKADKQRASIVCLEPPMKNHTVDDAIAEVNKWINSSQKIIRYVDTVHLIWGGQVTTIKK